MHLYAQMRRRELMHPQIGEPESMHVRMWGGLLQDTVSPLGDMVHYLAKAGFLQDMLLCMFVCFFFCFFVCNH